MSDKEAACRQLAKTIAQVADTRSLIATVQLTIFSARRSGGESPTLAALHQSVERLRRSIPRYQ